jgi:glycosyltransferase involved in cell wall biosynthesis
VNISVITPSLPTRPDMLAKCIASVKAQTLKPIEHLIGIDYARVGPSEMRNRLLASAVGDWVAVLDDDDLLLPIHLQKLNDVAGDIIYGYCEVTGRSEWNPNRGFNADDLKQGNYIPVTALIRTSLLRDLEGWRSKEASYSGLEDWDLYRRALDLGATFTCVPEITWIYRFHGGNRTDRGTKAQ